MRLPLIAIVGTTGVGKSNFSIELARAISGEIINGDSMQVYRGLDNITNKHPMEERKGVPHHLLGHVDWKEEYSVHRFEDEVLRKIDEIRARGKVPILVGGTHYYIQSVLFNENIVREAERDTEGSLTPEQQTLLDSDSESVLHKLRELDPAVAEKFHPNDTRRIRRMLEICFASGKKPSEVFASQREDGKRQETRFPTLVFWMYSDKEVLYKRLDDRVDQMVQGGLFEEVKDMYKEYVKGVDLERGVWQVIGFKQFLGYLEGSTGPEEGIETMKAATRRYSKQQISWVSKKLLLQLQEANSSACLLDATDLTVWSQTVEHGVEVAQDFLADKSVDKSRLAPAHLQPLLTPKIDIEHSSNQQDWKHFKCDTCRDKDGATIVSVGQKAWDIHLKSNRHVKTLAAIKRREHNKRMKEASDKEKAKKNEEEEEKVEENRNMGNLGEPKE